MYHVNSTSLVHTAQSQIEVLGLFTHNEWAEEKQSVTNLHSEWKGGNTV